MARDLPGRYVIDAPSTEERHEMQQPELKPSQGPGRLSQIVDKEPATKDRSWISGFWPRVSSHRPFLIMFVIKNTHVPERDILQLL